MASPGDLFCICPHGTGTLLSWLSEGDTSALSAEEVTLGRVGSREVGRLECISPHYISILGLMPGTGIHGVRAQCVAQPSAFPLHLSAPATFNALFFCLFMVIIIYLPTC